MANQLPDNGQARVWPIWPQRLGRASTTSQPKQSFHVCWYESHKWWVKWKCSRNWSSSNSLINCTEANGCYREERWSPEKEDFLGIHRVAPRGWETPRVHAKTNSHGPGRQGRHQHSQAAPCPQLLDGWSMVGLLWGGQLEDQPGPVFWAAVRWPQPNPHLLTWTDSLEIPGTFINTFCTGRLSLGCCHCSVVQACLTPCDPMDCSPPGFLVLHYLQEFAQTQVSDAIQPPHPVPPPSPYALTLSQPQGLKESDQQFNEVQTSPWGHPHPVPEICQAGHRSYQLIGYSLWVQSSGQRRCSELRRLGQYLCTYYLLTLGKYRCSWSLSVLTWKREIIRQFCQVIVRITWDDTHKIWGIVTKPYMLAATPPVDVTWYHLRVWISL